MDPKFVANTKIVQSFIQALIQVIDLMQRSNDLAQYYRAKWIEKDPDLEGTNITPEQIAAVNNFINELNALATGTVATVIKSKDCPSHGLESLEED